MSLYYRQRRRRTGRRLITALVVLVGLLIAADRVGKLVAERAAGTLLQRSQHLSQRPSVEITGFPFLTKLVTRHFTRIEVIAADVPVGRSGHTVLVHKLDVAMHDVRVAGNFSSATSQSSTATALIRYSDLSSTLGVPLSYAGGHRIKAVKQQTVAGVTLTATATVPVQLSGIGELTFPNPRVSVDGQSVPAQVSRAFTDLFGLRIPLQGMPFGVQVRVLSAEADGVHITLAAGHLTFRR